MAASALVDRYCRSYIASALRKGFSLDEICEAADVSADVYITKNQLYGPEDLSRLSRYVKRLMGDAFCGLTRRRCKPGTLALGIELVLPSKTLEEALDKIFRFYSVVTNDVHFSWSSADELVEIRVHIMEPDLDIDHLLAEWLLMLWRTLAGWFIGEEIPVVRTRFCHSRASSLEEYSQVFLSDCEFNQEENSIAFHGKYLRKPVCRDLNDLEKFFATSSIDLIDFEGVESSLKHHVRSLLKDHLLDSSTFYSMESIAGKLNLSSQSLRRRLEDEGTSFREIKEAVRREVAMAWLNDLSIPVQEVSRMCGFSEANGLTKAMKSWVGMSPTAYRENLLDRG